MLTHKAVVISDAGALTLKQVKLQRQMTGNAAIKIDSVHYHSRTYTEQLPIEVGIYYGRSRGISLEQDIHNLTNVLAPKVLGRFDVWDDWTTPPEALLFNAEEIGLYLFKTSDAVESVVFEIFYEEVRLTDTQLITLNRSKGYSLFYSIFK